MVPREQRIKEYSESRCGLPKGTLLVGGRARLIIPTTLVVPRTREHGGGSHLCARRFGEGEVVLVQQLTASPETTQPPTTGPLYSQAPSVTLSLSPPSSSLSVSLHWRCRAWGPQGWVPTRCMHSGEVTSQGHTYSLKSFLLESEDPNFPRVFFPAWPSPLGP